MLSITLPEQVNTAIRMLEAAGHEAYVVGGAVRDALLDGVIREPMEGEGVHDWDLTTAATPEEMKEVFEGYRTIETGIKHGTLTVLMPAPAGEDEAPMPLEITTYRTDGTYTDHRHPDEVRFTRSLAEDLARRDFTMNAMAYHPERGLVDLYGGLHDLQFGVIRCVGLPDEDGIISFEECVRRFREDALRILRGLRFSSRFGFVIEARTLAAMRQEKALLDYVAAERVKEELDKLLLGKNVVDVLILHAEILAQVLPEIRDSIGFDQRNPWHKYDVWSHCAHAVGFSKVRFPRGLEPLYYYEDLSEEDTSLAVEVIVDEVPMKIRFGTGPWPKDEEACRKIRNDLAHDLLCLRWAALFHDIGKPACFFMGDDRNAHFYGHSKVSAEMADNAMERLKFDNASREKIHMLVAKHDRQFVLQEKPIARAIREFGRDDLLLLMDLYTADCSAQSELARDRLLGHDIMRYIILVLTEDRERAFSRGDLAVDGRDMIALGLSGKDIGDWLERLLDAVVEEGLANDRETLLDYVRSRLS